MKKYIFFIKQNRKSLTILLIFLIILALIGVARVDISSDFDIYILQNSEYMIVREKMEEHFSSSEQLIFMFENEDDKLTPEIMNNYKNFKNYLKQIESIQYIQGPVPEEIIIDGNLVTLNELKEKGMTAEEVKSIYEYQERLEEYSPLVVEENRIYGIFSIFSDKGFTGDDLNKIENYLDNSGIKYFASGDLYLQLKIVDYVKSILIYLPFIAFILLGLVYKLQLGYFKVAFLSLMPAVISAIFTVGVLGWSGREVSILTALTPVFIIVIGSAIGLHFISHVQEAIRKGRNNIESLITTLKMIGTPMIITTLTSMIGFLSLLVMEISVITELAFFISLGILLAGMVTCYLLPLILMGNIVIQKNETVNRKIFLFEKIKHLWGLPSIIIVIILLIISFGGIFRINTEFDQLIYREFTEVYHDFEKIMEINRGSVPLFLMIETEENPLNPEYAQQVLTLQGELQQKNEVNKTMSIYNIYSNMYSQFQQREEPIYPQNHMIINYMSNILDGRDYNPEVNLVNKDNNLTRLMVFPADFKNATLDEINRAIYNFNNKFPEITTSITGTQYLLRELNEKMIENHFKFFLLVFVLIFVLLILFFKTILHSLISLLPIAITAIILYGSLGLTGISLNLATITIFSITLGVGINFSVHFISVWKIYKNKGLTSKEAVNKSYNKTAHLMTVNALGLALGLSVLLLSPFRIHSFISQLIWVSMISVVFMNLLFLPTLLKNINDE